MYGFVTDLQITADAMAALQETAKAYLNAYMRMSCQKGHDLAKRYPVDKMDTR